MRCVELPAPVARLLGLVGWRVASDRTWLARQLGNAGGGVGALEPVKPSSPSSRCLAVWVVAVMLPLNGCVTMGLWGSEYRVRPTMDHRVAGGFEPRRGVDWSWWRVALRIVATPGAVGIDVVTLPVQGFVIGQAQETSLRRAGGAPAGAGQPVDPSPASEILVGPSQYELDEIEKELDAEVPFLIPEG
jgi:hypothetical protein